MTGSFCTQARAMAEEMTAQSIEAARRQAATETEAMVAAEMHDLKERTKKAEERSAVLGKLLRTKNEIVWTLLQQQQQLKADNDAHTCNFQAFSKQSQEEFKGWIRLAFSFHVPIVLWFLSHCLRASAA